MRPLVLAFVAALLLPIAPSGAADDPASAADAKPAPSPSEVNSELQAVIGNIQIKIKSGFRTEKDLANEIKGLDAILAQHSTEKTEEVANVLLMKAVLYVQVLRNDEKGAEFAAELKKDFPGTKSAAAVDKVLASLSRQAAQEKIQESLAVGTMFPDFQEKDVDGNPMSVSALKGKVVLIDFWVSWGAPCVKEAPNLVAAYQKYHDRGFEILGISLDKDKAALTKFTSENKMVWPQYFDGLEWHNKLAEEYAVHNVPKTYLLDKDGKIIAKELRGKDLDEALSKALGGS